MTTTVKPSYGTPTTIAITLASLASDTNLRSGRQSDAVDNTADLADDALLQITIASGGTPTASTVIEVWLFGSGDDGTSYSAGAGAADAAFNPATDGLKNCMVLAGVINQSDTTARGYTMSPISVAQAFGGVMPDHWGVYVVHNTGTALAASGHSVKYTPVQYQNV